MTSMTRWIVAAISTAALWAGTPAAPAMQAAPPAQAAPAGDGTFLLTVFLKHDQSRPLGRINQQLREQGFYKAFPPAGVQVVSWYVVMGIGQVITLRVPAERLREVNVALEETAWGGYRTEFYPTYDYLAIGEKLHAQALGQ